MKRFIESFLERFDLALTRATTLQRLQRDAALGRRFDVLSAFPESQAQLSYELIRQSKSQLFQDLFVLTHLNFKQRGFFVEFGATNGVDLSNTHMLEKAFGWSGILAEPARMWHADLARNRTAVIETQCVWSQTGSTLKFYEGAEFSTLDAFRDKDMHAGVRKGGRTYDVTTISLNDLLAKHAAPSDMDYLSIDTEGSEFDILSQLDFGRYRFQVITCEHNFTPMRDKIHALLTANGYRRVLESASQYDDWYVRS